MEPANRTYKDKLFIDYFSDRKRLIEAYNALTGSDYPPDTEIKFATLDNVLYRSQNNDIAFIIDGRIVVLIEHQSSINENMPLRLLMYICEIYKRLTPQRILYSEKIKMIPSPEFYVIYNGKKEYLDRMELRLSDAFILPQEVPCLELVVPVYNISKGHNNEMLEHSTALADYSMFVSLVNDYEAGGIGFDTAVDKAIKYCKECGIMGAYLENSSEVRKMLITEWNDDEYREVMREEGREEGLAEVARNMKADGDPIEKIARNTGLPVETISLL